MDFKQFKDNLLSSTTEEDVKANYATYFDIQYDTSDKHDLYTPSVLFEFKYDKNFDNLKAIATVLAQTLYYIRRLKFDSTNKAVPAYLCLADKNEAAILQTTKWNTYYVSEVYDWERAPSKPDPVLVDHLIKEPELRAIHIYKILKKAEHNAFKSQLIKALSPQIELGLIEKKSINEENFEAVYEHWKEIIGKHINADYKLSSYFITNIQKDRIIVDKENSYVHFTFDENVTKRHKILLKDYEYFWSLYEYVNDYQIINGIRSKSDRLTDDSLRRFKGEFFTPLRFAKKAIHYLDDVLGDGWYKTGKYRIWDMAAGTGNLEWHLPSEAYQYLYLSTLQPSENEHNTKSFPSATCFQYDYLNDDVEYLLSEDELSFEPQWKLPQKLRDELNDESLTWIVYINPPFATAQVGGAKGESKKGVSNTKVEKYMAIEKIGHTKRELFAQFMYRITKELPTSTYLAMFSKLKYLNAPDSIQFRDDYFNYKYEKGFLFKSTNFQGVKGKYPIGFLIWNLSLQRNENDNKVHIDICDDDGLKVGVKELGLINKADVLNKWFDRPKNSDEYILPPLSNGITVKYDNKDKRHRARIDFIASVCSNGNDFQHAKYVVILSSPNASAGAFTVTPDNFEQSLVLHAVKKIPKPTWLNDRNQFLIPNKELSSEFINDCIVWSLFANSNESTALKDVNYNDRLYQITNNFFPFTIAKLHTWEINDIELKTQLSHANDSFVAEWLDTANLSEIAKELLNKAEVVYRHYFLNLNSLATYKYKIETWDAGWYQIRRCLIEHNLGIDLMDELKETHLLLGNKILPDIEHYGFLDIDEIYDAI